MNVLIALHNNIDCNSGGHVHALAQELQRMGCDCLVAVPRDANVTRPNAAYKVASYSEIIKNPKLFRDGQGPDLFHAWTPRELIRKFKNDLSEVCRFKLLVHMEDNEEFLSQSRLGESDYLLAKNDRFPGEFPEILAHPIHYREMLADSSGASVLIDSLREYVPGSVPCRVFWPAADPALWHPRPRNNDTRRELGIPDSTVVLAYHGDTHFANYRDVRSLYLSVALLNRTGIPAMLVRIGSDYVDFPPEYIPWKSEFAVELGWLEEQQEVVDALAMADIFVQPGSADEFNNYRFPSKLPEFFALGRPVILPQANIGLVTRHRQDAYTLPVADGASIGDAVAEIHQSPDLYARLSDGAASFATQNFCWNRAAQTVLSLYEEVLAL